MVLVTGGTGLLGTHLILALHRKGIAVKALYRNQIPDVVKDKANWIQCDILDVIGLEVAMQDVTQVYHVAGFVSFKPEDKMLLHNMNVEGTANVVNACLEAGVHKLVHVSSVAALGRIRKDAVINESMHWTEDTSNSEYGKSKYLGELEVWRAVGEGLNAVAVNPTIIIGEHGDWSKGSMQIFQTLHNGFPYYSMGQTGFVDADDVAAAMIQLMDSNISGQRFIISAENLCYRDFFYMIADAFGKPRPTQMITPFKAAIAWRLYKIKGWLTGKSPLVTKETAATSLAVSNFDNGKLLKALPDFRYGKIDAAVQRICQHLAGGK
ncbi:MAG: NAD-dependent epimerase/dehydratase family protein [Bacteroidetes bacterium]|uniref:NAD-dependent epimerase/dehydratase family protein n=1 Tax=Phnomibacter sp. TaxID=2836217 RepID=UPI002FDCA402|nr:NAD-dependent epimerase/dehydratase family protein [Bacteroidota bacterium]